MAADESTMKQLCTQLSDTITRSHKNNYQRIEGVTYFASGEIDETKWPTKTIEKSPRTWLKTVEMKTPSANWDDAGRIEVARLYALGSAAHHVRLAHLQSKDDWAEFSKCFLELYPEPLQIQEKLAKLVGSKRKPKETVRDFFVRLCIFAEEIKEADGTQEENCKWMTSLALINAMPAEFSFYVTDPEKKDPSKIYERVKKWILAHPEASLSDETVRKEGTTKNSTEKGAVYTTSENESGAKSKKNKKKKGKYPPCTHCKKTNHDSDSCWHADKQTQAVTAVQAQGTQRFQNYRGRGRGYQNRQTYSQNGFQSRGGFGRGRGGFGRGQNVGRGQNFGRSQNEKCGKCGFTGHTTHGCFTKMDQEAKCHHCGGVGHASAGCDPSRVCMYCKTQGHKSFACRKSGARVAWEATNTQRTAYYVNVGDAGEEKKTSVQGWNLQ